MAHRSLQSAKRNIAVDKEGFLVNLEDWSDEIALQIAESENIHLTEKHWEIIYLVRRFYKEFDISPVMRALVKYAAQQLGEQQGRSIYLLKLFPGSPAMLAAKIAGLPKPPNCL
jgi:tRNA 2-thiouridine synthesizing protein E